MAAMNYDGVRWCNFFCVLSISFFSRYLIDNSALRTSSAHPPIFLFERETLLRLWFCSDNYGGQRICMYNDIHRIFNDTSIKEGHCPRFFFYSEKKPCSRFLCTCLPIYYLLIIRKIVIMRGFWWRTNFSRIINHHFLSVISMCTIRKQIRFKVFVRKKKN